MFSCGHSALLITGIVTYAWIPITGFEELIDYSYNCELEATYNFPFQLFMIAFFFILPLVIIATLNLIIYLNIYRRSRGFVQTKPVAAQSRRELTSASTSQQQSNINETNLGSSNPDTEKGVSESTISITVQMKDQEEVKAAKPTVTKKRSEFNRHR